MKPHLLPDKDEDFEAPGNYSIASTMANPEKESNAYALHLVMEKYYHLDTCFCPLEGNHVMYYPPAFTEGGQKRIQKVFGEDMCIPITDDEAELFACNAVSIGTDIVLNKSTPRLTKILNAKGYNVIESPMSEFLLSGGSCKCCVLHMDTPELSSSNEVLPKVEELLQQKQDAIRDIRGTIATQAALLERMEQEYTTMSDKRVPRLV